MKNLILALFIALSLTACGHDKYITIERVTTQVIVPPADMTKNCDITPPPNKQAYLDSNWQGKESLLIKSNQNQIDNLAKCNDRLGKLRNWFVEQTNIYKPKPKE